MQFSHVPVVPDHDLSPEIRLFLFYGAHYAGEPISPTLYANFTHHNLQLLIIVLPRDSAEFGLTIAAIPIVLLLLVLCGIAVKQEIKWFETSMRMKVESLMHIF